MLVTGAARGQGRSHAVRLAQEGANIIAFDLCADIASNEYPLASPADLEETARLVKEAGQQVVTARVDVRDRAGLETALAEAVGQLGGLHVVVANAGICPLGKHVSTAGFVDAFDVNFLGVVNTVHALDGIPRRRGVRSSRSALLPVWCRRPDSTGNRRSRVRVATDTAWPRS